MGAILISFDYGRRTEYLTSFVLSPYAITVPIKGHDDRIESDFLCIGFEKERKSFVPNLKLLFLVQTKSQSSKNPNKVIIKSASKVHSILDNKMPYFIAIVNIKSIPKVSLYETSERIAFRHMLPRHQVNMLHFIPGMPPTGDLPYQFVESSSLAKIYMGSPFLEFNIEENYKRIDKNWKILKRKIEKEYENFVYASVGLGAYKREQLFGMEEETQNRIFFPKNGQLAEETVTSINIALQMLNLTVIKNEKEKDPNSKLVKAMECLLQNLTL